MLTVSSRANQIVEIRATYTVKGERYCIRYFAWGCAPIIEIRAHSGQDHASELYSQ